MHIYDDIGSGRNLGRMIKQHRATVPLTLVEMAAHCGVSAAYLGRIERGERFPSARVLQKIARPLGFEEGDLLVLAGYLSPQTSKQPEASGGGERQLDPVIAGMLMQEPVEVQRAVLVVLTLLKSIAGTVKTVADYD